MNQVTDNFSLSGSTNINSVGFYFQNYHGITGWNQDITYNFYSDNGGSVGSLLTSGSGQNLTATDSGLPWCCGGNTWLVEFDLVSTLSLASGNYWLGLTGATGSSSAWWVTTDYIDGSFTSSSTTLTIFRTVDFAYFLNSSNVSAVPIPATAWLFGSGLIGLIGFARRKARI